MSNFRKQTTSCKNGHAYTEASRIINTKGQSVCRICKNLSAKSSNAMKRSRERMNKKSVERSVNESWEKNR